MTSPTLAPAPSLGARPQTASAATQSGGRMALDMKAIEAAKHGKAGDMVIILTFAVMSDAEAKKHKPKIVYVDAQNRIVKKK